jgi:hypothetical protein
MSKLKLTCQYLTRDSQHAQLRECGAPAEFRALRGRRREPIHYCAACAALVKRHFDLHPIKP